MKPSASLLAIGTLTWIATLFAACGPGWGDYSVDLGNDFFYFSEKRMIAQNPRNDNDPMIPPIVEEFAHDHGFVIATQRPYPYDEGVVKYWILHTTAAKVYGPFSLEDYLKKRNELSVPEELKLNRSGPEI